MTEYTQGDKFPIEDLYMGNDDCQASAPGGLPFCNLANGHGGPHVAANPELVVVAVWH